MKILGLDLGISSIGWALIETDVNSSEPIALHGLGSRIVNLSNDETNAFAKANVETPNAKRTFQRTARKGLKRWKQRRKHLLNRLHALGMYDRSNTLDALPPLKLWELRAKAADPQCRLSLHELGRVLIHLNAKRGYRHTRLSSDNDTAKTGYVAGINERYAQLKHEGITLGQLMYRRLKQSETKAPGAKGSIVTYRIKEGDSEVTNLLPRQAHEDELNRILEAQRQYYPDILTDRVIKELHNIIFYQRPLKSCKNLVSRCGMFDFKFKNTSGKTVNANPKVAPRTSPVAQLTRIWETVNNLRLINRSNKIRNTSDCSIPSNSANYRKTLEKFELNSEERVRIAEYLNTHDKLTQTELLKLLGLRRADGFKSETNIAKGIKGNMTYVLLYNALEDEPDRNSLLKFDPKLVETVDKETGEIRLIVDAGITDEPLYRLWHLIYSIPDEQDLKSALRNQFGISNPKTLDALAKIDFTTPGFSNRSVKFMRRILPYLMEGYMYSEACANAGFRHSDYLTAEENDDRPLASFIEPIPKGELRQPLVEKVLNQMINLVNALIEKYGPIDEIRVELARELKQSKEQRIKATKDISSKEKENDRIARLIEQHGITANRRTIQKYRMWEETEHRCIYCNTPITMTAFLTGDLSEIEHIIPRSLFFDDSFSNKTCSCSLCNRSKGQMTAYDFMKQKGDDALLKFQHRVEDLAERKMISRTKLQRFLTPATDIPQDFIERDLQQTRYISRKAMEILRTVARSVYASSGRVTDFFRNAWGYSHLLENLNIERYDRAGRVDRNGSRTTIREWTKRLDHRHHAVDALTVALTRQAYITRLSTLNASRDTMRDEIGDRYTHEYSLLEQWASLRPHFSPALVMQKLSQTSVSFKSGKKATTPGYTVRNSSRSKVPRGPLHEETIYGRIYVPDGLKPLTKCLDNLDTIADPRLRKETEDLLARFDNDITSVNKHLQANPLLSESGEPITQIPTRRIEYVKREKVTDLKAKQIDKIIDNAVRDAVRQRFEECGSEKAFQQSVAERPLFISDDAPFPITRVTRATGLKDSSMVTVKRHNGRDIGFAKTGSNHHIAFYRNADGKIEEMVTNFWIAVKRSNIGLPTIISDPDATWAAVEQMCDSRDLEEVAASLPPIGSELLLTLATNDMVVLGLTDDQWRDTIATNDLATITSHLYRVQKLSSRKYVFRHHTHTTTDEDEIAQKTQNYILLTSIGALRDNNIRKVTVDRLGNIILLDHDKTHTTLL